MFWLFARYKVVNFFFAFSPFLSATLHQQRLSEVTSSPGLVHWKSGVARKGGEQRRGSRNVPVLRKAAAAEGNIHWWKVTGKGGVALGEAVTSPQFSAHTSPQWNSHDASHLFPPFFFFSRAQNVNRSSRCDSGGTFGWNRFFFFFSLRHEVRNAAAGARKKPPAKSWRLEIHVKFPRFPTPAYIHYVWRWAASACALACVWCLQCGKKKHPACTSSVKNKWSAHTLIICLMITAQWQMSDFTFNYVFIAIYIWMRTFNLSTHKMYNYDFFLIFELGLLRLNLKLLNPHILSCQSLYVYFSAALCSNLLFQVCFTSRFFFFWNTFKNKFPPLKKCFIRITRLVLSASAFPLCSVWLLPVQPECLFPKHAVTSAASSTFFFIFYLIRNIISAITCNSVSGGVIEPAVGVHEALAPPVTEWCHACLRSFIMSSSKACQACRWKTAMWLVRPAGLW